MPTSPHDKLFKETFGKPENAAVEMRAVLPPELLALIKLDSLTQVSGEKIGRDLSARHCDLLYQATIAGAVTRATSPCSSRSAGRRKNRPHCALGTA